MNLPWLISKLVRDLSDCHLHTGLPQSRGQITLEERAFARAARRSQEQAVVRIAQQGLPLQRLHDVLRQCGPVVCDHADYLELSESGYFFQSLIVVDIFRSLGTPGGEASYRFFDT